MRVGMRNEPLGRRTIHAPRLSRGAEGTGKYIAESCGGCGDREKRSCDRERVASPRWRATCGNRGLARVEKAGACARCDVVCDLGAVLHARAYATLHGCDYRGGVCTCGRRCHGSESASRGPWVCDIETSWRRGDVWDSRGGMHGVECGVQQVDYDWDTPCHCEGRDVAGWTSHKTCGRGALADE